MGAVFRKGNHMGRRGVFYTGPSLSYIKYEGGCVALFSTHKGKSTPKKFKPPGMNKEKDHVVPRRQQVARIRHLAWGIFKRQCYNVCMCDTFSGAPRFLTFFLCALTLFFLHPYVNRAAAGMMHKKCKRALSVHALGVYCEKILLLLRATDSFHPRARSEFGFGRCGRARKYFSPRGVKNVFDMRARCCAAMDACVGKWAI
jgi:hypothetical protein